ncbi:MAG TPA: hypothetical protein VFA95_04810 [Gammaproteobacteria bacterium]|nr:hypothetical protein [Gammaproteobacteria bacterium]
MFTGVTGPLTIRILSCHESPHEPDEGRNLLPEPGQCGLMVETAPWDPQLGQRPPLLSLIRSARRLRPAPVAGSPICELVQGRRPADGLQFVPGGCGRAVVGAAQTGRKVEA